MTFANDLFGALAPADDGSEVLGALRNAARERILILDGAMGTQIQGLGFDEDHFRGERVRRLRLPPAGQQRPPDPDPAAGDRGDPLRLRHGRRRHHRDQHLLLDLDRPGRLRHGGCRLRAQPRRRAAGAARGAARRAGGRQAPLRRRRARADQPHRLDLARRQQSRLSRRQLRRSAPRLRRAAARPDRRRRRHHPDRDDLRHAQRQGGDLRLRGDLRREAACDCR